MRILALIALALPLAAAAAPPAEVERALVLKYRAEREQSLRSDEGWPTVVGLYWLKEGENRLGSARDLELSIADPRLPARAGSLLRTGTAVHYRPEPGSPLALLGGDGTRLRSDAEETPSRLELGTLEFLLIERAGALGLRMRDRESAARQAFRGLEYFPIDAGWVVDARFESYPAGRREHIVNVVSQDLWLDAPGELVFERDGTSYRLEALLESSDSPELFIMFRDQTSGRETYGAGRFLYVPRPTGVHVPIDFNLAHNPPCAFTHYATCPLPPPANTLALAVRAGELAYHP
jgi:uncharacterized protein